MAFEYRYHFSVDEEILTRYNCNDNFKWRGIKYMLETRTNFKVKGRCGSEISIDSESYAIDSVKNDYLDYLQFHIGLRLKDYWMPNRQIRRLIYDFVRFAKGIAARPGIIPAAVDIEVCTLQRDGEPLSITADRAMRPEFLPPLYLYPEVKLAVENSYIGDRTMANFVGSPATIRVEDEDRASSVMEVCGLCGRKPTVGTQISTLRCGDAFHYHCIAPLLLKKRNTCPICWRRRAFKFSTKAESEVDASVIWHMTRSNFKIPGSGSDSEEFEAVDPAFDSASSASEENLDDF